MTDDRDPCQDPPIERPPDYRPEAKHWAGCTLNNYTEADIQNFATKVQKEATYYVFGKEIGLNGTPHLQFMVCFKKKKTLTAVKKLFPTAHLEIKWRKALMKHASDYCKKGGQTKREWRKLRDKGPNFGIDADFVEWGELPADQHVAGAEAEQQKWAEARQNAEKGDFDAIDDKIYIQNDAACHRIHARKRARAPIEKLKWKRVQHGGTPPNFWIWGPSGTGKSQMAEDLLGEGFYEKAPDTKWWCGYDYEPGVRINDIGRGKDQLGTMSAPLLKTWLDVSPVPVETKHGSVKIRPRMIVITSNYAPNAVFQRLEDHSAIEDRCQVIHMTEQLWWEADDDEPVKKKYKKVVEDNHMTID